MKTHFYATFTVASHVITERIEVDLHVVRPLESIVNRLRDIHKVTGVNPLGFAVALPAEVAGSLRLDRRFRLMTDERIADWRMIADALGVKEAHLADYFGAALSQGAASRCAWQPPRR